jgi:hypothetical protein
MEKFYECKVRVYGIEKISQCAEDVCGIVNREISVQYARKMSKVLTKKTMIGLLERHSCRLALRSCVIHTEGLKGLVRRKLIGVLFLLAI